MEKGVYQRIIICSKIVGVVVVAFGIDKLRSPLFSGFFYIALGSLISLLPEIIKPKIKGLREET